MKTVLEVIQATPAYFQKSGVESPRLNIEHLLAHQKELEKHLKSARQREASNAASNLLQQVQTVNGVPTIIHNLGDYSKAVNTGKFSSEAEISPAMPRKQIAMISIFDTDEWHHAIPTKRTHEELQ